MRVLNTPSTHGLALGAAGPATEGVEAGQLEFYRWLAGNVIVGPVLLLATGTTAVLAPGFRLTVTPLGSLLITR